MKSYKVLVHSILLPLIISSCGMYDKSFKLDDLSSEQTIEYNANCQPTGITVKIKGELNGSAVVTLYSKIDPGNKYTYNFAQGTVDTSMHGDWYSEDLFLHYLPVTASTGDIVVKVDLCGL